ncbi:Gypsy retrotransposon integrase-like protein 1 [Entomophthora muscae]|uniref:Gypsy retrotransposon integrase-like protein 1 n=1 Tax=Entomophthora muscae TaxID=34485 RepID=A0ACC2U411_9FUNG|nr:Gypsy retrotransposon integrase-like protein 1 [Entomophthora muscae]
MPFQGRFQIIYSLQSNSKPKRKACDRCRKSKIRCRSTNGHCEHCSKKGLVCTFINPPLPKAQTIQKLSPPEPHHKPSLMTPDYNVPLRDSIPIFNDLAKYSLNPPSYHIHS